MRTRPVRIDQVIPSIVERDAVSHHTLEAQRVLHSLGFVSEIYACNMGPGLAGRVHPLKDLPARGASTNGSATRPRSVRQLLTRSSRTQA